MNQVTFIKENWNEEFTVKVGDVVEFKSDIEQVGIVTKITRRPYGGYDFHLKSEDAQGFRGEYIRGMEETVITEHEFMGVC